MRTNIRQDVVLTSRHMSSAACVCCSVHVVCIRRTSITIIFNKINIYNCVNIKRKIDQIIWIASLLPWIPSAPLIRKLWNIYWIYRIWDQEQERIFIVRSILRWFFLIICIIATRIKSSDVISYTRNAISEKSFIITAADNIQSIIILSSYRPN